MPDLGAGRGRPRWPGQGLVLVDSAPAQTKARSRGCASSTRRRIDQAAGRAVGDLELVVAEDVAPPEAGHFEFHALWVDGVEAEDTAAEQPDRTVGGAAGDEPVPEDGERRFAGGADGQVVEAAPSEHAAVGER